MEQTKKQGAWTTVAKLAVALIAGVVVFLLLSPAHTADTLPLQCFAVLGNSVSCGPGLALAPAIATVGVVGLGLWLRSRST